MVYPVKTRFIRNLSQKDIFWSFLTEKKELFLTFDDGPIPDVTEFVLSELDKFSAKATFFCVGDNVRKNQTLFEKIQQQGHSVGNHTFHHLNGWGYSLNSYLNNVQMCHSLVGTKLFRPPYGRITPLQRKILQRKFFIILWSVLPGDFDSKLTSGKCLSRAIGNSDLPGSIIVMHDSIKSDRKLRYVLPKFLKYFTEQGYQFSAITEELCTQELEKRKFLYPEVVL